jgi:hypothetical protein
MTSIAERITNFPYSKVSSYLPKAVVGSVVAAAGVGIAAIVVGTFGDIAWRAIGTIALFLFFSLATWYDADVSAKRSPWFGALSFVTSMFLFIAGIMKLWLPSATNDLFFGGSALFEWIWLVAVARIALIHVHIVINTKRRLHSSAMDFVSDATLVLVGLLAVMLSLPAVFVHTDFSELYWRAIGVIAILDALGTVLIPLTYALFEPKTAAPVQRQDVQRPAASTSGAAQKTPVTVGTGRTSPAVQAAPVFVPRREAFVARREPLMLAWPRYANGKDLPAMPDGLPDFRGVLGYPGR